MKKYLPLLIVFLTFIHLDVAAYQHTRRQAEPAPQVGPLFSPLPQQPELPQQPATPNITNPIPQYLPYDQLVKQLEEWRQQAPDLTETGTYGTSSRGQYLHYIRVTNKLNNSTKKKVLVTAAIHGNEPLSTTTIMTYIGAMLARYGREVEITELLDTRDFYFVPVFSPDSYPHSRFVDGVDPNRNFPGPRNQILSVAPVQAIQDFFLKHKFNAVISGHTFGRIFLIPYGDRTDRCPNTADYDRVMRKVCSLCQYRLQRACEMYSRPIYGSEVDWFYRHGSFAVVMEFGSHQHVPSQGGTKNEFDRTFKGVLHFFKEAPLVNIVSNNE